MSLIQYRNNSVDPFRELLKEEFFNPLLPVMEKAFKNSSQFFPALDVSEERDSYTIKADLPGIKKEDVHVSFENGLLTIEGERKDQSEEKEKNYHRVERTYGRFVRSFNLGTGVDANKIQANYKDGVLEITIGKSERAKPKAIDIKVA
jgi:HSP20 family protein